MPSVDISIYRKEDKKWYFRVSPAVDTAILAFIITDLNEVRCEKGGFKSESQAKREASDYGGWLYRQRDVEPRYNF